MTIITKPNPEFFENIRHILREARQKAYANVNFIMVEAYWKIGQRIVEEEQGGKSKAVYGEGILKSLSRELTAEFGKGFSCANPRNFRQFYLTYPNSKKCYTLCSKLTWKAANRNWKQGVWWKILYLKRVITNRYIPDCREQKGSLEGWNI